MPPTLGVGHKNEGTAIRSVWLLLCTISQKNIEHIGSKMWYTCSTMQVWLRCQVQEVKGKRLGAGQ